MNDLFDFKDNYIEQKSKTCFVALDQCRKETSKERVALKRMLETGTVTLSRNALKMALLLVNGLPELRSSNYDDSYYWIYQDGLSVFSKRYEQFNACYPDDVLWTDEYRAVLDYFYGQERTDYVVAVWNNLHQLMYQKGSDRRAFRAPNIFSKMRVNQLNFLIKLNAELSYDLDMETSIIHDYRLYHYGTTWRAHIWAAAIDAGNTKIFQLLVDIVYQRHPIGKVSEAIIRALLLSHKKEAWEAVKDLLLSAQRQEGLRQTILECLDETSLGAMKYIMKVILDNNLTRFSSVVRAIDTWTGLGWESAKQSTVKRFLELGYTYLTNPELISEAIKDKDNAVVYMALWAQGVLDVEKCYPLIKNLYEKGGIEKRCLALYFANQTKISKLELEFAERALEEDNLKLLYWGLRGFNAYNFKKSYLASGYGKRIFEKVEKRLEQIPKKGQQFASVIFSWLSIEIEPSMAHNVLLKVSHKDDEAAIKRLLNHFSKMSVSHREKITRMILPNYYPYSYEENDTTTVITTFQRDFAFSILTDRAQMVRTTGMNALADATLNDEELQQFEALLKRKSAETRKSVIQLILKNGKKQIITSTERLLAAKSIDQRLAALDLLNQACANTELKSWVRQTAKGYYERPKLTEAELILLRNITDDHAAMQEYTLENGLGLYNPKAFSTVTRPVALTAGEYVERTKKNKFGLSMPVNEIDSALKKLHDLIKQYQDYEYEVTNWNGHREMVVLGNSFRQIENLPNNAPKEERIQNYPLADVWINWCKEAGLTPCDLFLLKMHGNIGYYSNSNDQETFVIQGFKDYTYYPNIPKIGAYDWQNPIYTILELLMYVFPYEQKSEFLKGLITQLMAVIPDEEVDKVVIEKTKWHTHISTWRDSEAFATPYNHYSNNSSNLSDADFIDYWALEYWSKSTLSKKLKEEEYQLSKLEDVARAYELNLIKKDELYQRVLKTDAIDALTKKVVRKHDFNYLVRFPFLKPIIEACSARILEIELSRGDSSTVSTPLAQRLNIIYGIQNFVAIFKALGKESLNRGYIWGGSDYSKKQILSQLLKGCYPLKTENQKDFDTLVKEAKLTDKRLIEAAVYAQQWIPFVSNYLKWKGLDAAIWWLHAHTNAHHTVETETEIAKYSKIALTDFQDGAVDTAWFKTAYKSMGKAKWKLLYDAAKYISDGVGHKRAQLYADVILGNTKIMAVTKRVKEKRNQDYLRVYGLIPLSRTNREKDLLKRYQYLQKFKKESKQFGSQRQTSEGLAVRIAMDNLARTAGYRDPIRLTWAMETKEAQQIIEIAKPLTFGNVSILLSINELGKSSIICKRDGKTLKAIPAKLRKEKAVVELKAFNKTLRNQYSRTRKSLEDAMVNGDSFTKEEINNLLQHPIVKPMLRNLLVKTGGQIGFATLEGVQTIQGKFVELAPTVRIAHCYDIYESGDWSLYQSYCFKQKLVQPFKQIFRELYLPTEDELKERTLSRRYAGHQVQTRKTVALLKTRGWTVGYEEGLQKVYHKEGLIAKIYAMADWFSPADVESPTLETIEFLNRKNYKPIPLEELDASIFSEVMRDIDLVVSVAHVGGVDPEASHSTVEMRAVIVKETARLFKLDNVTIQKHHVYIDGNLGRYTVHLGSAVCHKIPGHYLSILPVHSQHRGRLFLPFVDDDPRSAEVMSKVLLLAKDDKIQDPTVLNQLVDKAGIV